MLNVPGGWLSGPQIRREVEAGNISIDPFSVDQLNPNSYNYRLSPTILRLIGETIDVREEDSFEEIQVTEKGLLLLPSECYLGATLEKFGSNVFASLVTGRSSIGRKFITNHVTAGLIDQGFFGSITLEITVQRPTRIYPAILFGQIFWFTVVGQSELYAGKYSKQIRPTGSKSVRERFD